MLDENAARMLVDQLAPGLSAGPFVPAPAGYDKSVCFVGEDHMVRVARHEVGRTRMVTERRVLARLGGRLGPVRVPEVVAVTEDEYADVCRRTPGVALDWRQWAGVTPQRKAALGEPVGAALAALHDAFDGEAVAALGLPAPRPYITGGLVALRGRTGDPARELLLDRVLEVWDRERGSGSPDVVLHTDLGLHNLSLDPESLELRGIFDFGDAAVGDLHLDLRYDPTFEVGGDALVRAYTRDRGVAVSARRQALLHAMAALGNLLHSIDHEEPALQTARRRWVDAVAAWHPSRFGW